MINFLKNKNAQDHEQNNSVARNDQVIVFLWSNQVLTAINLKAKKKVQSEDIIKTKFTSQVASKNKIIDPSQFGELLADIAEVFTYKNSKSHSSDKIPCIFFIEGDKFHIENYSKDEVDAENKDSAYKSNTIEQLSPYILSDSHFEVLKLNEDINTDRYNLIFTNKSYLMGWADAIKKSGLSAAYIGPIITPIICKHTKLGRAGNIYVVVEKLTSKIYHVEKSIVYQYSLPFGTAQLYRSENQYDSMKKLSNQITNVLEANNLKGKLSNKVIIPIGWPATKNQLSGLINKYFGMSRVSSLEETSKNLTTEVASSGDDYLQVKDLCFAAKACMECLK